jgi:hypothetical protein
VYQLQSVVVMVNYQMKHIGSCEVIKAYKEFREELTQGNYRSLELLYSENFPIFLFFLFTCTTINYHLFICLFYGV